MLAGRPIRSKMLEVYTQVIEYLSGSTLPSFALRREIIFIPTTVSDYPPASAWVDLSSCTSPLILTAEPGYRVRPAITSGLDLHCQ